MEKPKAIKMWATEVDYPFVGGGMATLRTNDKKFIESLNMPSKFLNKYKTKELYPKEEMDAWLEETFKARDYQEMKLSKAIEDEAKKQKDQEWRDRIARLRRKVIAYANKAEEDNNKKFADCCWHTMKYLDELLEEKEV